MTYNVFSGTLNPTHFTFGQILTFGGLLYQPPYTDKGQIWCAIPDPWCTLTRQIPSGSVYSVALSPLWWRKPPIFAVFWTSALMSTVGNSLTKLNTGAQLRIFPYPTTSKSFLHSNAFMAKSGAKALMFKSVTNRQTKNSMFLASPEAGEIRAQPNLAW